MKKLLFSGLLSISLWLCSSMTATEVEAVTVVIPPEPKIIEEVVIEQYEEHLVYTTANVNAREYPTTESASLAVIPQHTELLRVGEEINGWDCVIVNEQELFIKHEYLTTEEPITYLGEYELTAYCACSYCCGKDDGITASGTKVKQGRTVANNALPFGTELVINGNTYIVEDRGNPEVMTDRTIDVFFDSHDEAKVFGRQTAEVYIKN